MLMEVQNICLEHLGQQKKQHKNGAYRTCVLLQNPNTRHKLINNYQTSQMPSQLNMGP